MKIINQEKLANVLTQNWTKFLDYKTLMDFVINTVQLYVPNWSMLQYCAKIQGNKITVSKVTISKTALLFFINFEVIIDDKLASGTLELSVSLAGEHKVNNVYGNVFYID